MSLRSQFATNVEKEVNGTPIPLGKNQLDKEQVIYLAYAGKSNKAYQLALTAAMRPHERARQLGTLSPDVADKLLKEVFAKTVVKGWDNVTRLDIYGEEDKAKDEVVAFDKNACLELFEALPHLYDFLFEQATSIALFKEEQLEDEAKN